MRIDEDEEADFGINLTPMIDVVFLLLIFFLVATTFAREELDMDLRLPEARSGIPDRQGHLLVVNVLADGRITVDGREIGLEGLRQRLRSAAARDPEQAVQIRSDERGMVGATLRVLDAVRTAKLSRVDFAALPDRER
ncbi:MAG: biopolymer transporter ExbD [Planctomycetota bacterium]